MKRILLILAALALGATTVQAQVRFETGSTDSVRKKALESGKLVFIDLYATWCGPCRTMERDVFSRRDVGEFMERWFVAAKYDVDRSTGQGPLAAIRRPLHPDLPDFRHGGRSSGTHPGGFRRRNLHGRPAHDPRPAKADTGTIGRGESTRSHRTRSGPPPDVAAAAVAHCNGANGMTSRSALCAVSKQSAISAELAGIFPIGFSEYRPPVWSRKTARRKNRRWRNAATPSPFRRARRSGRPP